MGGSQRMKANFISAMILSICQIAVSASASDDTDTSKRLVLAQGRVLHAYFAGQYREIRRAELFYGYGWLDGHRVFVASQKGRGEAVAELEVIDLRQSQTTKLVSLGGVGESNFDVSSISGEVVFGDSDGIKLLKIDSQTNAYKIEDVKKGVYCYGSFWVDAKTVGCLVYKNEKPEFMKFPVQR
jgi:hypothetical protein